VHRVEHPETQLQDFWKQFCEVGNCVYFAPKDKQNVQICLFNVISIPLKKQIHLKKFSKLNFPGCKKFLPHKNKLVVTSNVKQHPQVYHYEGVAGR
jgi:hypothetical protein